VGAERKVVKEDKKSRRLPRRIVINLFNHS